MDEKKENLKAIAVIAVSLVIIALIIFGLFKLNEKRKTIEMESAENHEKQERLKDPFLDQPQVKKSMETLKEQIYFDEEN